MEQLTTHKIGILDRLFRRMPLDPATVQQGSAAALADAKSNRVTDNPHAKGTVEYKSWKIGYDKADDSTYVW
ncbi:hypothetical protein LMG28727_04853 [Paraburkholderia kirstenboschensis]|uniref:hypothetical protein n=1 Tax=Paraburkholderia kirstenboschensis TaxID=1245436 RepID=UPI000AE44E14|nr:hypothetical protein [Paraburkholderia kirstenboschensis]CAD6548571.1 hypothetical protein LMG28727_04853 [Paraburkholderia kirstenboschensis]